MERSVAGLTVPIKLSSHQDVFSLCHLLPKPTQHTHFSSHGQQMKYCLQIKSELLYIGVYYLGLWSSVSL